ncbi:MAG: hypothetical protein JNM00_01795 [Flavobacteriales bacterium]|nr:hypothetical protein [Flavobacteriales bacterium]
MKNLIVIFATLFAFNATLFGQRLSVENTYEITGKANRGYLGNINIDEPGNLIELTYVTKSNDRLVKFETYQFDLDFNFKNMVSEEIEFEKARTKYKWFKYKGETYQVEAVSVEANFTGTLVLKRKLITYKWSWWWGGYDKDVKLLEKVKPKNDEGNKYYLWTKAENDETGEVMVIVGEKDMGKGADMMATRKNFSALVIDRNLDITHKQDFTFQYPQHLMASYVVSKEGGEDSESEDLAGNDLGILFAPAGGAGMKKVADPDPKNYTFMRFGNDASLIQRTDIHSPNELWGINGIATVGGNTFIYGPAKTESTYANEVLAPGVDVDGMKWEAFQLCKLNTQGLQWITASSIDDFEAKVKAGPSQKKVPAYKGKKFRMSKLVAADNDLFIMGQNFKKNQDGGREYTDPVMFHFSQEGSLKAQYGVHREENNIYARATPCYQDLILSNDGQKVYWLIGEVKGVREDKELTNATYKVLLYPNVGRINLADASIGDFVAFGEEKYFLNNSFPMLPIDIQHSTAFFGESKNGRTLWFGKMPME